MKTPILLVMAAVLAGCDNKSNAPAPAATTNAANGGSPLTAPVDYLGAVARAQQTAVKTVDTVSLNQAIQQFEVDRGRNPKDLNELVQEKYIPKLPQPPYGTKLVYDPGTGTVKVQPQ